MQKTADKRKRQQAREVFARILAQSDDYREAAAAAGVSERTGRNWRNLVRTPGFAEAGWQRRQRSNLPQSHTQLIGRRQEREQLCQWLRDGRRLITIAGAPGIGKTRLALELGHAIATLSADLLPQWDGIWFCELLDASCEDDLWAAMNQALHRCGRSGPHDCEGLGRALSHYRDIWVLDNADPIVDHVANAITRWLDLCPNSQFIVTSRQPLQVPGEQRLVLGPLAMPSDEGGASSSQAVDLFVDRARLVQPNFTLDDASASAVVDIVQRLDGLPLAIELAATQLDILTVEQLKAHLMVDDNDAVGGGLDLLEYRAYRPQSGLGARSLGDAIAASWRLLAPVEQSALAQCAVFRGGFTLEAFAAVIDHAHLTDSVPAPAVLIQTLMRRSLVYAPPLSEQRGQMRYHLLESIRIFAQRRLNESGLASAAEARHTAYYQNWLGGLAYYRENVQREIDALNEQDNLLIAFRRFLSRTAEQGIDKDNDLAKIPGVAALAVIKLLWYQGRTDLVRSLLDEALVKLHDSSIGDMDESALCSTYIIRFITRHFLGDMAGREHDAKKCLDLARNLPEHVGSAALCRGMQAAGRGHYRQAVEHFRVAVRYFEEANITASRMSGLVYLCGVANEGGDTATVIEIVERTEAVCIAHREEVIAVVMLAQAARALLEQGRAAEARTTAERMAAMDINAFPLIAVEYDVIRAWIEQVEGDLCRASEYLERALRFYRESQNSWRQMYTLLPMGLLAEEMGDVDRARRSLHEALELANHYRNAWFALRALAHLARLAARAGFIAEANGLKERAAAYLPNAEASRAAPLIALTEVFVAVCAATSREQISADWHSACQVMDASKKGVDRGGEIRIVGRLLEKLLTQPPWGRGALSGTGPEVASHAASDRVTIVIGCDGQWVWRSCESEFCAISSTAARAMLQTLATERLRAPGKPVSAQELLSSAWGNLRIQPKPAANRLNNALSHLRAAGLRGILLRATPPVPDRGAGDAGDAGDGEPGFLLDPQVGCLWLTIDD